MDPCGIRQFKKCTASTFIDLFFVRISVELQSAPADYLFYNVYQSFQASLKLYIQSRRCWSLPAKKSFVSFLLTLCFFMRRKSWMIWICVMSTTTRRDWICHDMFTTQKVGHKTERERETHCDKILIKI